MGNWRDVHDVVGEIAFVSGDGGYHAGCRSSIRCYRDGFSLVNLHFCEFCGIPVL